MANTIDPRSSGPRSSDVNKPPPPTKSSTRYDPTSRPTDKGKGKERAKAARAPPSTDDEIDLSSPLQLLNHSFSLHSVSPLWNFKPVPSFLLTLQSSLRSYLSQQLPDLEIASVSAAFVPIEGALSSQAQINTILIEVQAACTGETLVRSLFALIPSLQGVGGRKNQPAHLPLLLSKAPAFPRLGTSLAPAVIEFIQTRYDAQVSPYKLAPRRMTDLLERRVATQLEEALPGQTIEETRLTYAFPPALNQAGLASATLTLPGPLVKSLLDSRRGGRAGGEGFAGALSAYIEKVTGLGLNKCALAKMAVGGVFVHSGLGAAASAPLPGAAAGGGLGGGGGGGGAKVKFVKVGELYPVLVALADGVLDERQ